MSGESKSQKSLKSSVCRYDDPFATVVPEPAETLLLDGATMRTWDEFHTQCAEAFGFPDFNGRNLNAWIDCVADMRIDSLMTKFRLDSGQVLQIELANSKAVRTCSPDIFAGFLDAVTFVNERGHASGYGPLVSIVLV